MNFFIISVTAFSFFAAVIIFSYFGKKSDNKNKRIDFINEIGIGTQTNELEKSFYERYIKKATDKLSKVFTNLTPKNKAQRNRSKDQLLERQLRLAGVFMSASEFGSIKLTVILFSVVFFLLLALFMPIASDFKLLIILLGTVIGVIGPTYYLRFKVRGHQEKIREQLPDAIDLLGVCIEAGLSFDISLLKVSEKLKGPFIDELLIVHREIQMGRPRREALQNLASATDIPELKTFAAALVQAEQLGIPVINVMRIQSAQLRVTRRELAREKGMKAPIKMILPMVGFIFPVIFIILLGPTVINVIQTFSNK